MNAILDGKPVITDVTIVNPELPRYDQLAKESRLDVAAKINIAKCLKISTEELQLLLNSI